MFLGLSVVGLRVKGLSSPGFSGRRALNVALPVGSSERQYL